MWCSIRFSVPAQRVSRQNGSAGMGKELIKVSRGKRTEPRIPFGQLIERGLIKPGETLYDPTRRSAAKVRADGSLVCKDATGSIHKIGAMVMRAEACNGWTFWHVRKGGSYVPIDLLRQQVRQELSTES
jgi:modification methylase